MRRKVAELVGNWILILAVIIAGTIGVESLRTSRPVVPLEVGARVRLPSAGSQGQQGKALVIVISKDCHFCRESTPFYRRLAGTRANGVQLIWLSPQSAPVVRAYLSGEGIDATDVREASLADIGVMGTPTIILMGKSGVAMNVWRGRLAVDQESEVIDIYKGASMSRPWFSAAKPPALPVEPSGKM